MRRLGLVEISPALRFDRPGRLAMANNGPGTAGSQFFITETAARELDGKYTIFGQCGGIAVVKAIARLPRNDKDKPGNSLAEVSLREFPRRIPPPRLVWGIPPPEFPRRG